MILVNQMASAQPVIALGCSRNSVLYDNMNSPEWRLIERDRLQLTYISDSTLTEVTYFFAPDDLCRLNKTCVEMQVLFTSRWWLQDYIEKKTDERRLLQVNYCTYRMITDLYDLPVYVFIISDLRLSIKYKSNSTLNP